MLRLLDFAVNWNYFRLIGDFMHLGGMVFGLAAICTGRSVDGFSRKTQVLYQTVYITRYLDIFVEPQGMYLFCFKVTFNAITAAMLYLFAKYPHTYDISADSCNVIALFVGAGIIAYVSSAGSSFEKELWAYSEFLEPLALVPQYIMCYRVQRVKPTVVLYVLAVGGYRLLYVCNWIYKRYKWHGAYHDYISWCGGILECVLFADFALRISQRQEVIGAFGGATPFGRLLLTMDNTAGMVFEKIEMNTIGRRLPLGLSGHGKEDHDGQKQWSISDQHIEEEGCHLLMPSADPDFEL